MMAALAWSIAALAVILAGAFAHILIRGPWKDDPPEHKVKPGGIVPAQVPMQRPMLDGLRRTDLFPRKE